LAGVPYDFKIFDDPNAMRNAIEEKNQTAQNRARMVAGYCWEWRSKTKPGLTDVVILEHGFEMTWNLTQDGGLWILNPDSINQIGCIHTCQGLEVDYIGVVIGPDLQYRNGEVVVDATKRAKSDASIKGWKRLVATNPKEGKEMVGRIIKNTYRTLMTRGMKGCYIWCADKELAAFFKASI
jgi:DUF2075 family protein